MLHNTYIIYLKNIIFKLQINLIFAGPIAAVLSNLAPASSLQLPASADIGSTA